MSIAYPKTYPCASRIEGHSAAIAAGLVRTPMGAGNTRQRRDFRNLPHVISLVFVIPQGIYASWLSWCNKYAWDEWIDLMLPGLHAGALDANTAPTPVKFCTDIQAELLTIHRKWIWRVRVSAEYMPTPADFPVIDGGWIIGGTPTAPAPDWILAGTPVTPAADFTNPGTPAFPAAVI